MQRKNNSSVRTAAILVGITMCVMAPRCARAQHALGDGQVLDRNLRVGSGGKNTQVQDLQALIRFNNAVVTGNAPGGKSFRGNVGYLSGDDFRATLGSNDLFSFRRDTQSSALVGSGIRGTDALRYQFALSTGQTPPAMLGNVTNLNMTLTRGGPTAAQTTVLPSTSTGTTAASAMRSTSEYSSQQNLRPMVLGYKLLKDGRTSVLTASPLLGITSVTMGTAAGQSPTTPNTGLGTDGSQTPGNAQTIPSIPTLSGLESVPGWVSSPLGLTSSLAPSRVETNVATPKIVMDQFRNNLGEQGKAPAKPDTVKPDVTSPPNPPTLPTTPNAPTVPTSPTSPTTEKPPTLIPTESAKPAWEAELDRIRKALGGKDEKDTKRPSGEPPASNPNGLPDPNRPIPSSTSKDKDTGKDKDKGKDGKKPKTVSELIDPETGRIDRDVLKAMQATRPLVTTLVNPEAPKDTTYAGHMSAGETLLADGKYFDAEDAFTRALAVQPKDPFARVGRIHAELGAGLYLSAAANLKLFFTDHPEMMGTRYSPVLLPSELRVTTLVRQLENNITDKSSAMGPESAFLLAYLGYQRSDAAMLKRGVEALAAKMSGDDRAEVMLLALMQKVWVEGQSATPSEGDKK